MLCILAVAASRASKWLPPLRRVALISKVSAFIQPLEPFGRHLSLRLAFVRHAFRCLSAIFQVLPSRFCGTMPAAPSRLFALGNRELKPAPLAEFCLPRLCPVRLFASPCDPSKNVSALPGASFLFSLRPRLAPETRLAHEALLLNNWHKILPSPIRAREINTKSHRG